MTKARQISVLGWGRGIFISKKVSVTVLALFTVWKGEFHHQKNLIVVLKALMPDISYWQAETSAPLCNSIILAEWVRGGENILEFPAGTDV